MGATPASAATRRTEQGLGTLGLEEAERGADEALSSISVDGVRRRARFITFESNPGTIQPLDISRTLCHNYGTVF